jgi:hypothetical protein
MTIEQTALSLYQLLGAPLYALIEAETYAANATADFIERVGFEHTGPADHKPAQADLGKLRTLTFQQERRTSDGQGASYKVEVPLLSVLPVPALQIKEAELEFYVKIIDMVSSSQPAAAKRGKKTSPTPVEESQQLPPAGSPHVPTPPRLDMKAMLGRGQPNAPHAPQTAFDMQVHIKIKVAQADVPAGLSRLFNLMEQSISSTRIEE